MIDLEGYVKIVGIQDDDNIISDYFNKGDFVEYSGFVRTCAQIYSEYQEEYGFEGPLDIYATTDYTFWLSFFTDRKRELGMGIEFMFIEQAIGNGELMDKMDSDFNSSLEIWLNS